MATLRNKTRYRPCLESLEDRLLLAGDAVLRWNDVAIEAGKVDHSGGVPAQGGPTRTARALAVVHAAIFDAVNAIDRSYQSYLTGPSASAHASLEAAIAAAGHDTLAVLYPAQKATFDQALAQDLVAIPDGPAESEGVALGQAVAALVLAARQQDGSQVDPVYTPGMNAGDWRPEPLHATQAALTPGWGAVNPFVIQSGSQFRAPPPPALPSPAYAAAYEEVRTLGGDDVNTISSRSPEQTQIGIFWGYDGTIGLGTPPRLYNQIAQVIARQRGNTLVENARLFALVNLAMADAGIAIWETKYVYNFWRPVTAIRAGLADGNVQTPGDPTWTPLGAPNNNGGGTNFTPPFPAYTSGHAGFGAALFRTLAHFYGSDNIAFTIGSDEFNGVTRDQHGLARPVLTRSFSSFSQAAEENGQSRIYLGIHWSFDKVNGIAQGNAVADYVYQHALLPVTPNQRFVVHVYEDLLGRTPEEPGLRFWEGLLDSGVSRTQVVQAMESSAEYRSKLVRGLYRSLLRREAESQGLSFFMGQLAAGRSIEDVQAVFLGSDEYLRVRGQNRFMGFLDNLYQDVLGRHVDAASAAALILTQFRRPERSAIVALVLSSAEAKQNLVKHCYEDFLRRPVEGAGALGFWVSAMQHGMQEQDLLAAVLGSDEYFAHR